MTIPHNSEPKLGVNIPNVQEINLFTFAEQKLEEKYRYLRFGTDYDNVEAAEFNCGYL